MQENSFESVGKFKVSNTDRFSFKLSSAEQKIEFQNKRGNGK